MEPVKPLCFHEMGAEIMLAEFEDLIEKTRVIKDDLWNFDKCLILVKEFDGGQQMKNIFMKHELFWIRVHDLPLIARNEHVGRRVGLAMGRVDGVDVDFGEVEWGEHMRVRVELDITKHLICQKKFNIGLPEYVWLRFTYERLPDLYFLLWSSWSWA